MLQVHFILSGEEEETDVRTFADNKRKIFCRGNLDGFLMAVPRYFLIFVSNDREEQSKSW